MLYNDMFQLWNHLDLVHLHIKDVNGIDRRLFTPPLKTLETSYAYRYMPKGKVRFDFNTRSYASNLLSCQIAQLIAAQCLQTLDADLGKRDPEENANILQNIASSLEGIAVNLVQPIHTAVMKGIKLINAWPVNPCSQEFLSSGKSCHDTVWYCTFKTDTVSTAEYDF